MRLPRLSAALLAATTLTFCAASADASSPAGRAAFGEDPALAAAIQEDLGDEAAASEIERSSATCREACSETSKAALRACRNETDDEYWIAFGKCLNLEDEDERKECLALAREERAESKRLCREQFRAREDVCELLGDGPFDPEIDPEDFLTLEEAAANPNPYFPLAPGTRWVYEAGEETIEVVVTDRTKVILGVECFEVNDVVRIGTTLVEDTLDWYALDEDGNVWYFGEAVKNYEDGELSSLDGSWKAGVDGAKPGILMLSDPESGDAYRQEFFLGDAEDLAKVLSDTGSESVPAASCDGDCVVTEDITPIEPGNIAHKYYAPGIGLILEVKPESGEREELVEFDGPAARAGRASAVEAPTVARATRVQPNPFSNETTLRFDLARESDVVVDVYDATGRKVRTLVDGRLGAGAHSVRWNGDGANAKKSAAGVYFARVKTNGQTTTHKVVLTK